MDNTLEHLYQYLLGYGEISEESFYSLLSHFDHRLLNPGDIWIRPGDIRDLVGIQASGLIRCYMTNEKGQERTTDFCRPGDLLLSLENGTHSEKWIQALEASRLFVVDRQSIESLIESDIYWQKLLRNLTEKCLGEKIRRETQLLSMDAKEKYQYFLKEMGELTQRIPQYHIASYLGISPVSLSRLRGKTLS